MESMNKGVKHKQALMVIVLGLIIGVNQVFSDSVFFLYAFDTLAFAVIIALLYGVRKDVDAKATPLMRRKIFWILMVFVGAMTLTLNQFLPRPVNLVFDVVGIALMLSLWHWGYRVEDREVDKVEA